MAKISEDGYGWRIEDEELTSFEIEAALLDLRLVRALLVG